MPQLFTVKSRIFYFQKRKKKQDDSGKAAKKYKDFKF